MLGELGAQTEVEDGKSAYVCDDCKQIVNPILGSWPIWKNNVSFVICTSEPTRGRPHKSIITNRGNSSTAGKVISSQCQSVPRLYYMWMSAAACPLVSSHYRKRKTQYKTTEEMLGLTKDIYTATVLKSNIKVLVIEFFHSMLLCRGKQLNPLYIWQL